MIASELTIRNVVHPFEASGLGKAPFRFLGMTENVIKHFDGTTQPGGCCDHCDTGIRYEFRIKSSDGIVSKVGCDCVMKLDRDDNLFVSDVELAKRLHDKKARAVKAETNKARDKARIEAAFATLDISPEIAQAIASQPHPSFKGSDANLLTYILWMRDNAGISGKLKCVKIIEDAAKA